MKDKKISQGMIGTKILLLRMKIPWDEEELAGRVGITRQSLINIEYGKNLPKLITLVNIAEALGASLNELLGLELTCDESEIRSLKAFKKQNEVFSKLPKKVRSAFVALAEEFLEQ